MNMFVMRTWPLAKTMAFGGVAMGSEKAMELARAMGTIRARGLSPVEGSTARASAPTMLLMATFEARLVSRTVKTIPPSTKRNGEVPEAAS